MRQLFFCTLMLAGLLGCGSGATESLRVSPQPPVVRVEEKLHLRAEALEDLATEPQWELQELHGGALLRSQGLETTYVAPPMAGTYHLVLRAQRADGKRVKQSLELTVLPQLSVEPSRITLAPGARATFELRAKGLPKGPCTWVVEEPEGGTVTKEGVYTAPAQPGTYHLTASPAAGPGGSATATLIVR